MMIMILMVMVMVLMIKAYIMLIHTLTHIDPYILMCKKKQDVFVGTKSVELFEIQHIIMCLHDSCKIKKVCFDKVSRKRMG